MKIELMKIESNKFLSKIQKPIQLVNFLVIYGLLFTGSLYTSFTLFFDFRLPSTFKGEFIETIVWLIPLKLLCLYIGGQYRVMLSYFRMPDAWNVLTALTASLLITLIINHWDITLPNPPKAVFFVDYTISTLAILALRTGLRYQREHVLYSSRKEHNHKTSLSSKRVAIIGAGDIGSTVAIELFKRPGLGLNPIIFLDKNKSKWGRSIHGIPIVGHHNKLKHFVTLYHIEAIVIAAPWANKGVINEITQAAQKLKIKVEIVPTVNELINGLANPSQIRPIKVEDLLFREPVKLETHNIAEFIKGKTILVTGAGGSIGSELCSQIAIFHPNRILLIEQSEYQLFTTYQKLLSAGMGSIVLPLAANILDQTRMEKIFNDFKPEIVFHAAAHKHVPMMERQPGEAIKNNTLGTKLIADLSLEKTVQHFVLISTDKAINPTNVMGASKRLAEIYIQNLQKKAIKSKTCFMAVRFGNVLGSSGSVIPIFEEQLACGGPLTVTHPDVTRFFMSISEAVGLVLQAATLGQGGEIFVLDMGNPIKIKTLAEQMIKLHGFEPHVDVEIKFTGLRPGEKLFEEVSHITEELTTTANGRIFKLKTHQAFNSKDNLLDTFSLHAINNFPPDKLKQMLKEVIPEYTPFLE